MYYLLFSIVWVLAVVVPVGAQQEMRSATKGSSTPLPITGTAIDAIPAAAAITSWTAYEGAALALDLTSVPTWQSATYSARPDNTDYDAGAYEFYTPDVHVYVEYTEAVSSSPGNLLLMGVGR